NMRTLSSMPEAKQRYKSLETLEVYAPLAHRLGIQKFKWELEDLALSFLDPVGYQEIEDGLNQKRQEREEYIEKIIAQLNETMEHSGVEHYAVEGRAKHFYSIYRKMFTQNKSLEEIYDLFAVRVIVESVSDCYAVLGLVHEMYTPVPGRFKDYIAMPKPKMYQSQHSTVIGEHGIPFEIQIRTWEMHRTAEYGIAAHWKYKEGATGATDVDSKLAWVRQMLELQDDVADADEFKKTLKIDLFADEVFVFTPKGDVISLPVGATPIDFAYAIHSAVGNRMTGAKVNGHIVPLDYALQNGEFVEVITSSANHGPSRDWLKVAKTSQARNKINQWFKRERRDENIAIGKEQVERELHRNNLSATDLFRQEYLDVIIKRYGFNSLEDLYLGIGYGAITAAKVIARLKEEYKKCNPEVKLPVASESKRTAAHSSGVVVEGIDNCLVKMAKCCNPVPGDAIIGYITRGRGVSVHRCDCVNVNGLNKEEAGRLIHVSWEERVHNTYIAQIELFATDRDNLVVDIVNTIADHKIPLKGINARAGKNQTAAVEITLEIVDSVQLDRLIYKLMTLRGVDNVSRKVG
ncbi:MAG: bifunctional (p)ppGpp synthetase/guanosine-3',5'-bis(diphosphate) 3'-pyrophosphohydrolase, partial [Clostridia bacterium]|nr:bifunctional (p)ppGpp synthetase/guanosine-3',5'-bis(diphosphate) 3'-pyrophosphohydrolase [Clostridia bacterium]